MHHFKPLTYSIFLLRAANSRLEHANNFELLNLSRPNTHLLQLPLKGCQLLLARVCDVQAGGDGVVEGDAMLPRLRDQRGEMLGLLNGV